MSKIGNETKLVLTLAKQIAENYLKNISDLPEANFHRGYRQGITTYENILDKIIADLER